MWKELPLSDLRPGQVGQIAALHTKGAMRRRLQDLGFLPGQWVKALQVSPLGEPTAYLVQGTMIALRKADAAQITVRRGEQNGTNSGIHR